jgi:hypothetical protein
MTREEAIKAIKSHCYFANLVPIGKEALDMAIKALEQEPILDKIKAEIKKLDDINPDYPMDRTIHISRSEVLQIIDKYKYMTEVNE